MFLNVGFSMELFTTSIRAFLSVGLDMHSHEWRLIALNSELVTNGDYTPPAKT